MKIEVRVPSMGESVVEATMGTQLAQDSSHVAESQELCEIETEKVNQILFAPVAGVIIWQVTTGQKLKVGDLLATIETESVAAAKESVTPAAKAPKAPPQAEKKTEPVTAETPRESPSTSPIEGQMRRPMSQARKTIARRLVEALHTSAMLTTFNEIDMTALMQLRAAQKAAFEQKYKVKLGLTSFFVFAALKALQEYPELNGYIEGDEIVQYTSVHMGIAIGGAKGGLVVPVIREAEKLHFSHIEIKIADMAKRAAEGKLTLDELRGGSFTITNGGVYGSLLSTPLLSPQQSGVLGLHKIEKRACVVDNKIEIRDRMYVALSYDHRLIDGKQAIGFLVKVKEILEKPDSIELLQNASVGG